MRSFTLLSTAVALAGVRTAAAQEIRWTNPLGGSWNLASNWENGEIPDSPFEIALIDAPGSYTVEFDRSTLLRGVRLLNANATIDMRAGDSLYIPIDGATTSGSPLTINGVLTVNTTAENRPTAISICDSYAYDYVDAVAAGTGTIRLNAHPDNLDSARIGAFCTIGKLEVGHNQTIAGTGRIELGLDNWGTISADVPGRVLEMVGYYYDGVANGGTMRALNGGILRISRGLNSINYNGTGLITIDALSTVQWNGADVEDMTIDNTADGESVFFGTSGVFDVRLLGTHNVAGDSELWIAHRVVNDGALVLRSDDSGPSILGAVYDSTAIRGNGTVYLNGTAELPTLARVVPGSLPNTELIFESEQTLAGTGQVGIDVLNEGTLSPGGLGGPIGLIELQSTDWTQDPGARLVIDVGGPSVGQYDRLTRVGQLNLDGALVVRLVNGFEPDMNDEFVIATHFSRNGQFATVQGPVVEGRGWRVRYDDFATVLTLGCVTDLNGDGQTGLVDLALLLSNYGRSGAGVVGDVDADGTVTLQDLASFLRAFGGSCE